MPKCIPHGNYRCMVCRALAAEFEKPTERQVGGSHYANMKIQPFEFSMANGLNPMEHTAVKYIVRRKPGSRLQDLEKAKHTIDLLIQWEKENGND